MARCASLVTLALLCACAFCAVPSANAGAARSITDHHRKLLHLNTAPAAEAESAALTHHKARKLQQDKSISLNTMLAPQETADQISTAAAGGASLLQVLGATTNGNTLARQSTNQSLKTGAFDLSPLKFKAEKRVGGLRRP